MKLGVKSYLYLLIIAAALVADGSYQFWKFLERWDRREFPVEEIPAPRPVEPASLCPKKKGRLNEFLDCWSSMQTYRDDI